jgi:hypothetical protein
VGVQYDGASYRLPDSHFHVYKEGQMNNETKMVERGLKGTERYYYHKFGPIKEGRALGGVMTVCVVPVPLSSGHRIFVRGVAFCSPKDQFCKKLGRTIALGRAIKATEREADTEVIPSHGPAAVLRKVGRDYFSEFGIDLTSFEKTLFEKEG